jgi:hypothetical protein
MKLVSKQLRKLEACPFCDVPVNRDQNSPKSFAIQFPPAQPYKARALVSDPMSSRYFHLLTPNISASVLNVVFLELRDMRLCLILCSSFDYTSLHECF